MKTSLHLVVLAGLALSLLACSQIPVAQAPNRQGQKFSAESWERGDQSVAYVNSFEREPAALPATRYKTVGKCGGLPKIDVKTAPGFCVGLVYDGSGIYRKLRWAAPLSNTRVLVTEMGGWVPNNGAILVLDFAKGKGVIKPLLTRASFKLNDPRRGIINEPNQISRGPDGLYYVGAATGIYRFNPRAAKPAASVEVLVGNIPAAGLHPLKSFAFDDKENLFVNVGSSSNVCQNFTKYGDPDQKKNPQNFQRNQFDQCPEAEDLEVGQGQIRRYTFQTDRKLAKDFKVYAKGLRNSIGLAWDGPHGALLVTENGRDAVNKFDHALDNGELPHERIVVLREGAHFGWPYCYDDGKNNPEWFNMDCSKYDKAQLLLPAHSAPLGLLVYDGALFPSWYKGRSLAALHGYAQYGHRIVTFHQDDKGLPTGIPQSLVYDWEKRGTQGMGKPVGLTQLDDGSVLVVEDEPQNKVLRLFYDSKKGDGKPVEEIVRSDRPTPPVDVDGEATRKKKLEEKIASGQAPPFSLFEHKVVDKYCYECHQAEGAPGVQLVRYDDTGNEKRIRDAGKAQDILNVVNGAAGAPAMPPQGWDTPEEQAEAVRLLQQWLAR